MISITRRQFLQYCAASAAALGLSQMDLLKLEKAFAANASGCNSYGAPNVIWIQGQSCGGCTLSILNRIADATEPLNVTTPSHPLHPLSFGAVVQDVADLVVGDPLSWLSLWYQSGGTMGTAPRLAPDIWDYYQTAGYISLDFQTEVIASAGEMINEHIQELRAAGGYIVAVSGSIPLKDLERLGDGLMPKYCITNETTLPGFGALGLAGTAGNAPNTVRDRSIVEVLPWLASNALAVLAFGTCASWGGIPAASGNSTRATSVYNLLNQPPNMVSPTKNKGGFGMGVPVVNIPGCAPHPDWMMFPAAFFFVKLNELLPLYPGHPELAIAATLAAVLAALDTVTMVDTNPGFQQPRNTVNGIYSPQKGYDRFCQVCPRNPDLNDGKLCIDIGAGPGYCDLVEQKEWCTRSKGCNGYIATPDCPTRTWNKFDPGWFTSQNNQWCAALGTNYVCQGCAEPDFPDGRSPFFEVDKDGI